VNKGILATNNIPKILNAYANFQSVYMGAVAYVASNTNAIAPQALVNET